MNAAVEDRLAWLIASLIRTLIWSLIGFTFTYLAIQVFLIGQDNRCLRLAENGDRGGYGAHDCGVR